MPSKKSAARNTRNLFDTSHGAGKGSKPRPVQQPAYRDNYDAIDWGRSDKRGSRVVLFPGFDNFDKFGARGV
jgi:hypothetical protein